MPASASESNIWYNCFQRARSSAVERYSYKVDVLGPIPSAPTVLIVNNIMPQDSEPLETTAKQDVVYVGISEAKLPPGIIEAVSPTVGSFAVEDWLGIAKEFILPKVKDEQEKQVRAAQACLETVWNLAQGKPTNRNLNQYMGMRNVAATLSLYRPESREIKDRNWRALVEKYRKRAKPKEDPLALAREHRRELEEITPTSAERVMAFFAVGFGRDIYDFPAYGVRTLSSLKQEKIPADEVIPDDVPAFELGMAVATACQARSLMNSENRYLTFLRHQINGEGADYQNAWSAAFRELPNQLQTVILSGIMLSESGISDSSDTAYKNEHKMIDYLINDLTRGDRSIRENVWKK